MGHKGDGSSRVGISRSRKLGYLGVRELGGSIIGSSRRAQVVGSSGTQESYELRAQGVRGQEITVWVDVLRYWLGMCGRGGGPY